MAALQLEPRARSAQLTVAGVVRDAWRLSVTGRDVDESEYALRFTADNGSWTLLDGPAGDYAMSGTRADIMRYLRAKPGTGPKAIADALGISAENARKTCQRMVPGLTCTSWPLSNLRITALCLPVTTVTICSGPL
jgi:hypothetical protein